MVLRCITVYKFNLLDGLADLTTRGELITIRIIPVFGSKD